MELLQIKQTRSPYYAPLLERESIGPSKTSADLRKRSADQALESPRFLVEIRASEGRRAEGPD